MKALFTQLCILYLFVLLGWVLGKWKKDMANKSSLLSFLLVNLFFPCKLFLNFSQHFTVSYIQRNYVTLFISIGILLLLALLGRLLPKLLTKHSYERKVYGYNIAITNYAYLGYVLVEEVFGAAALNNMMVFCIPSLCIATRWGSPC